MLTTHRASAPPRWTLPKPLTIAAAVVVLPVLMAVLAFALTMLTRMLVERQQEPVLHWPTFWVWFVLCTGALAVPMTVAEIRRDHPRRHPAPPDGARLTLTVQDEEDGPVTRVCLESPDAAPVFTLVRAHELSAADVGLMEQLTRGGSALGVSRGDTHELNAAGLALVATSTGAFRDILSELLWRARHEPVDDGDLPVGSGDAERADEAGEPAGRTGAARQVDVFHDETIAVPKGPAHHRVRLLTWAVIGLYAVVVVAMLVWRGVSDAGRGPDIDAHPWAMNLGAGTALVGPFVIWGSFGLQNYVRAHEARGASQLVAARARADFWFFGLCSALVMVFLGAIVTAAVWVGTEGFLPTLVALAVTAGLAGLARWSQLRWRAWSTVPHP